MTTKKLAGKPKGNAIVPIPFPTPTRCLTQTPGALKREKSQSSDPRPPIYSILVTHQRAKQKTRSLARFLIDPGFEIELLAPRTRFVANAT